MTGKTLREQLPAGDPRNKVEFLADQLQLGLEELAALKKLLGGKPVVNLIQNGKFESPNGSVSAFNIHSTYAAKHQDINEVGFCEAASPAMMMPEGWGGESVGENDAYRPTSGSRIQYIAARIPDELAMPTLSLTGNHYKAVAFAPFKAQSMDVFDEINGRRSQYVTVAAMVRRGLNCRWGLVEISPSTGHISDVVFCEEYTSESEYHVLRKDGLLLNRQKLYALAFFEQTDMQADGLSIGWAAAFFNDEQDPTLLPTEWPAPPLNEFHVLKSGITKAQLHAGVDIAIGHLTGSTRHQSNHVALRICQVDMFGGLVGESLPVTEVNKGDGVITVSSKPFEELEFAICAKVTAYPQRIGFFKQLNSTHAFETLVPLPE